MLDCERWTLTHSSVWAEVLVELGLELAFGLALALWLGLAARRAASDAEAVGEAVLDDDAEADGEPDDPEGDPDGDLDPEGDPAGEPDLEAEPVGAGDAGARLGLEVAAGELGELGAEEDGVGVAVLDGFGVGVLGGVGVGVGVGVLEAGSTWQLVSVFALALVEVPALGEAAVSGSGSACAGPGRPASTPRVRKPPPSTLSATTRPCSRRLRIAMSPLLVRVTFCSSLIRRQLGDGWPSTLISDVGLSYACIRTPDHGRAALAGRRPSHGMGRSPPPIGSVHRREIFVPSGRDANSPSPQAGRTSAMPDQRAASSARPVLPSLRHPGRGYGSLASGRLPDREWPGVLRPGAARGTITGSAR